MTRKDSEKDSERPHYYSQFWLDIAAGRRVIGGPKPEDGEATEAETAEPVLQRRPGRVGEPETFNDTPPPANEYREQSVHPDEDEEYSEPEEDLTDNDELNEDNYQEGLPLADGEVPDVDLRGDEEENEDLAENETAEESEAAGESENLYEDDDDGDWDDSRGRKKAKSPRPSKVPIKKSGKSRRTY